MIENHQQLAAALVSATRGTIFINWFRQFWNEFDQQHSIDVYALCLSEHERDDVSGRLSMWRGGRGAALVFNTTHFAGTLDSPLYVGKVDYGTRDQRIQRFRDIVSGLCQQLPWSIITDDNLKAVAYGFYLVMLFYSLVTKDIGFQEEHEWRVVYMPMFDPNGYLRDQLDYAITARGVEPKLKMQVMSLPSAPSPGHLMT